MPIGPNGELLPYDDVPEPEIPDPESIGFGVPPVVQPVDFEIPALVDDSTATLEDIQALREQALDARGMLIPGAPEAANFVPLEQLRQAQAGLYQLEPLVPALEAQEQREAATARSLETPMSLVPAAPVPLAPGQTPEAGAREVEAAARADVYSNTFAGARQALGTSQQIAGVQGQIDDSIAGLQQRYAAASPEERTAIEAELQQKLQERAAAAEVKALADDEVAVEQARANAAVKSEYERYALAENEKALDEVSARRQKAESELAQKRQDREAAVAKVNEAEKKYVELLKKQADGDTATTVSGVAAIVGEMWQAFAERRPPNTAAAIDNILKLGRERLDRQRDAAQAEVQDLSGDVTEISASMKEVEAERAEKEVAILTDLERRLTLEQMRAQGTPREIAIAQAGDATRATLAAKRQEAVEKRAAAVQDQRLKDQEIRLKGSQADKAAAEAGKIQNRGSGGGGGLGQNDPNRLIFGSELSSLPKETREEVRQLGIKNPVTGRYLRTDENAFYLGRDTADAKSKQSQAAAVSSYTRGAEELSGLISEWGFENKHVPSQAKLRMNQLMASLSLQVKNMKQTGALDKGSQEVSADYISGGELPGSFFSDAEIILKGAEDAQKELGEVMGIDAEDIRWPSLSLQRGEIEKQAKARGGAAKSGDHTGKATTLDPLGEADSSEKFALSVRANTESSKDAPQRIRDNKIPATPKIRKELIDLVEKIDAGDTSPATRDAVEERLRKSGLLGEKQNFVFPSNRDAAMREARTNEMRADAIRVANWLYQNNADPRKGINPAYLRNAGVIKHEHEDQDAFARSVADAYKEYGQKKGGKSGGNK